MRFNLKISNNKLRIAVKRSTPPSPEGPNPHKRSTVKWALVVAGLVVLRVVAPDAFENLAPLLDAAGSLLNR